VHLFRPSLGFLAEAQPRLDNREDKKHFLGEVHITFFRRPYELQSKLEKLQIYLVTTVL
jgi:type IV secretory pathway VirD2 relaxase